MSADYAVALVESGAPQEIERAQAVIDAVLDCQDMDPRSPHYGNFRWEHEDLAVEDLNAVQFVLVRLIPLLLNHADLLVRSARLTSNGSASASGWTKSVGLMFRPSTPTSWRKTSPTRSWAASCCGCRNTAGADWQNCVLG